MNLRFKFTISILLVIVLIVFGFIYLLRGCLSKYDERSAQARVLYFKKDTQSVIFSIVKFEKATSYSSGGGFTRKTVSTNYFIQINDAISGKKILEKKIKHQRDIKNHPVEILGASGNTAWAFINEPMAFDPFTLIQTADKKTLEDKNPSLKGKFPVERRYYKFNNRDQNIYFTASDGSGWLLDTKTLIASSFETDPDETNEGYEAKRIEKQLKEIDVARDSLMEQKLRRPSRLLATKEITIVTYRKMMEGFNEGQTRLYKKRDSLQALKHAAENLNRYLEDIQRRIKSLNEKTGVSFSQLKVNADTIYGRWYGLYSKKELETVTDRFQYQTAYNETARRQLYTSSYAFNNSGDAIFSKEASTITDPSSYFLDGGLLLSKETGKPIRLPQRPSFLIIFRNQIGNEGKIKLSSVGDNGKIEWTLDSQLREWADYIYTGKQLFITGTDNKELSSSDCNVLWCIDLDSGKAERYDFFTDK